MRPVDNSSRWGGARPGAGRPKRGPIASERHLPRRNISPQFPVHVVARLARAAHALGRRRVARAIEHAARTALARTDFRIVRLAIQPRRLELVVEADDKRALARGMQGFQVSAARAMNRMLRRRGAVFPDRYRMAVLGTRAAVRAVVRARPAITPRDVITVASAMTSLAARFIAPAGSRASAIFVAWSRRG